VPYSCNSCGKVFEPEGSTVGLNCAKCEPMKDPNLGLLLMAFSMVSPTGPMYEALTIALTQFVENTTDIEDDLNSVQRAEFEAAHAMLDILNGRHAALAKDN
jgi:hypothetical protein